MKGTLIVGGLTVKYKTKYYKTSEIVLNHEAIDVKYKIVHPIKYWFYKTCEVARKEDWYCEPIKEEFEQRIEYFNSLLKMSQEEIEKILVDIIQNDINERFENKRKEMESNILKESFKSKFN
jgi:hypothetical protein